MKRLVFILIFALCAAPSLGQGTVLQSGAVTTFHAPAWFSDGVVADAGGPSTPFLDSLGLFDGGDCPFGISSQLGPGTPTGQYSTMTICQTNSAATFSFQAFGGLPDPTVYFQVGGSTYEFPYTVGGIVGPTTSTIGDLMCWNNGSGSLAADCGFNPYSIPRKIRVIPSGASDNELFADVTIMWKSSTASTKTENLLACNSTNAGIKLTVLDDLGTSSTYPIIEVPNGSDTIANAATPIAVVSPMLPITIICDGAGNWAVTNG